MDILLDLLNNNLMVIVAGAVGGLLGLLVSHREIRKIIRLLRTSTSEIGMLPSEGQVEMVGSADGGTTTISPITKTTCALWQVEVLEKRSSGKSSHWVTIYKNTSTSPFDISDGTGKMRIYPSRYTELILRDDVRKSSGVFSSLDEETQAVLQIAGITTKGALFNRALRVYERYIEPGESIYLLGTVYSKNGTRILDDESPLIISDQSELRLLSRFIWRVVMNALIGAVAFLALADKIINR